MGRKIGKETDLLEPVSVSWLVGEDDEPYFCRNDVNVIKKLNSCGRIIMNRRRKVRTKTRNGVYNRSQLDVCSDPVVK